MSVSAGSEASANPGKPSVIKLTQRICIAKSGIGKPKKGARKITQISPEFPVMMYLINFRILSNIFRPCFTATTIVAKLSSSKIICEASLDTSVPLIPIAIPMSAFFNAGASLTPSPVMATK
ncbi:hypothetical protein D3C80_1086390 [compost metagenome]